MEERGGNVVGAQQRQKSQVDRPAHHNRRGRRGRRTGYDRIDQEPAALERRERNQHQDKSRLDGDYRNHGDRGAELAIGHEPSEREHEPQEQQGRGLPAHTENGPERLKQQGGKKEGRAVMYTA